LDYGERRRRRRRRRRKRRRRKECACGRCLRTPDSRPPADLTKSARGRSTQTDD
jgi:hypothetical protein